jgi:hypothetical protein
MVQPVLLLALESYFTTPSISCLAQLYDSINAMDLSLLPWLSDDERLILRASERKELFEEKFPTFSPPVSVDHSSTSEQEMSPSTGVATLYPLSMSENSHHHDPNSTEDLSLANDYSADSRSIASSTRSTNSRKDSAGSLSLDDTLTQPNRPGMSRAASSMGGSARRPRDTHYYETKILFDRVNLPIRVPVATFPEEVGDVSLFHVF